MGLIIIDFLFVAILGVISYLSSNSIIISIIVVVMGLFNYLLIFNLKYILYQVKITRYYECFDFMNSFIVSLSVTNSLIQAFERTTLRISKSLRYELDGITNLDIIAKIHYLKKYFPFYVYEIFVNLIDLFLDQGGDILEMSSYLLKEGRTILEYIDACKAYALRKVIEIIILWAMSMILLVFIRFGLSQFFIPLSQKPFYQICILIYFALVIIASDVSLKRLFDVDIRGFKGYEKVKKIRRKH